MHQKRLSDLIVVIEAIKEGTTELAASSDSGCSGQFHHKEDLRLSGNTQGFGYDQSRSSLAIHNRIDPAKVAPRD